MSVKLDLDSWQQSCTELTQPRPGLGLLNTLTALSGKELSVTRDCAGNWSIADGEHRLRFGVKGPNQHWEHVIHRGDLDRDLEI